MTRLVRVWATTAPAEWVEEAERGAYPSLRPRLCWNLKVVSQNITWAYEQRDLITASGLYTATKIEVVEIAGNGAGQ